MKIGEGANLGAKIMGRSLSVPTVQTPLSVHLEHHVMTVV